ncbi:MAG: phosphomannomutase/phosphoglucomutase [Deltaproteobacteria bacterium]|nr:phosphomannomutase/phosphoglucomutase [Deltaproteobacteria bacterium]
MSGLEFKPSNTPQTTQIDYQQLRSGSDVRAVAMENPGGKPVLLTNEVAKTVACAFAIWLAKQENCQLSDLTISVGRDSRLSGEALQGAIAVGLSERSCRVYSCDIASTPAMFMTTRTEPINASGAIMVTASHHPAHMNGMKFIKRGGGLSSDELKEVLTTAQTLKSGSAAPQGEIQQIDFMKIYAEQLRNMIMDGVKDSADRRFPLAGLKIAVDASHGVSGFFSTDVLAPLGADVSGSQYLEPDGNFPAHKPNPEDPEAMASICRRVTEVGADLGVIFDTDGDRVALVDRHGQSLGGNRLVALAAAVVLKDHPGSWIVVDSIVSPHVIEFIENLGGQVCVHKRGYNNVIKRGKELDHEMQPNGCYLAIECSGHAALKDNYWLDDGAYLAVRLIVEAANMSARGENLGDLTAELVEPKEEVAVRIPISGESARLCAEAVIERLREFVTAQPGWSVVPRGDEGVRIAVPHGCVVLRPSVHDPELALNIETDEPGGIKPVIETLAGFFTQFERLNLDKLSKLR